MQRSAAPVARPETAIQSALLDPLTERESSGDRLGLFIVLAIVGMVVTLIGVGGLSVLLGMEDVLSGEVEPIAGGADARTAMVFLAGLAFALAALALPIVVAARLAYARPIRSFITPARRFSWTLFGQGAGVMLVAMVLIGAVSWLAFDGGGPTENLGSPLFGGEGAGLKLAYVAVAMVALFMAAAAEEVVFRGVLLQATAGFVRHGWLLCLINGVLFSAIHLDPDPVAFVARAASGAVWAWAALRLGGLEYGLGAHWIGNLVLALTSDFTQTVQPGQGFDLTVLWVNLAVSVIALAGAEGLARRRRRA